MAHLPLRALEALLTVERDDDSFAGVLQSLQEAFAFDQALVLDGGADVMRCVAAVPPALAELQWSPGPFFRRVAGSR